MWSSSGDDSGDEADDEEGGGADNCCGEGGTGVAEATRRDGGDAGDDHGETSDAGGHAAMTAVLTALVLVEAVPPTLMVVLPMTARGSSLRPPVLIVKNHRYAPAGRLLRGVWPSTMYNDHAL
jgi:hypothetical protein